MSPIARAQPGPLGELLLGESGGYPGPLDQVAEALALSSSHSARQLQAITGMPAIRRARESTSITAMHISPKNSARYASIPEASSKEITPITETAGGLLRSWLLAVRTTIGCTVPANPWRALFRLYYRGGPNMGTGAEECLALNWQYKIYPSQAVRRQHQSQLGSPLRGLYVRPGGVY
jgi:hypothetical protein